MSRTRELVALSDSFTRPHLSVPAGQTWEGVGPLITQLRPQTDLLKPDAVMLEADENTVIIDLES